MAAPAGRAATASSSATHRSAMTASPRTSVAVKSSAAPPAGAGAPGQQPADCAASMQGAATGMSTVGASTPPASQTPAPNSQPAVHAVLRSAPLRPARSRRSCTWRRGGEIGPPVASLFGRAPANHAANHAGASPRGEGGHQHTALREKDCGYASAAARRARVAALLGGAGVVEESPQACRTPSARSRPSPRPLAPSRFTGTPGGRRRVQIHHPALPATPSTYVASTPPTCTPATALPSSPVPT
jgi:hypothetical protein